jgi:hypothetical protein
MTGATGMTGPDCRDMRQLLGVYVVGAIDPAERAQVDSHLTDCWACTEELGGMAGLPALLGRVPLADAEKLSEGGYGLPDMDEPPAELLHGLLGRVATRRRNRVWRSVLALAAAVAIAAGGTAGVLHALQPNRPADTTQDVVRASSAGVASQVHYSATPWGGSTMRIAVMGIQQGTLCQFWVANAAGKWSVAARWTMGPGYGEHLYWVSSPVDAANVRGFKITSAGMTLLNIPAD